MVSLLSRGPSSRRVWVIDGEAPECTLPEGLAAVDVPVLKIWNKIDVVAPADDLKDDLDLLISAQTGAGLDGLIELIGAEAGQHLEGGAGVLITRARHRALLQQAREALAAFLNGDFAETEFRAEDLRRAAFALGRITGNVDVEDVLDQLFFEFCIGK